MANTSGLKKINMHRQKWFYFLLIMLVLIAVGLGLAVNHRLSKQYDDAVKTNQFWSLLLREVEELENLALEVNAPGNDIFRSKNIKLERERVKNAHEKYTRYYESLLQNLKADQNFPLSETIEKLEKMPKKMAAMLADAENVFKKFDQNQKNNAAYHMAEMDKNYALLRRAMSDCRQVIIKTQSDNLLLQKKYRKKLYFFEVLFLGIIVLIVFGILIYGFVLSRLIDSAVDSQRLLEEQTHALNESAIVAITDAKGKITYVNEKFSEITGFNKQELIGKDHRIINSRHHPKEFFTNLWETISQGKVWRGEVQNKKKDGTFYWVDSTIVPMKNIKGKINQYIAIRYDISERKRIEDKLDLALQNASMAIWSLDLNTYKVWRSKNHDEIFGYKEPLLEWTFKTFLSHLSIEDREQFMREFQEETARSLVLKRYKIINTQNKTLWIEVIAKTLFDLNGHPVRMIGTTRDITQQVKLEEELTQSKNEALMAARTKSMFLANMSHEIRTPLNGIIGMTQLVLSSTSDPELTEKAKIILNSGTSLLSIINDVLDFSKLEMGKIELEKIPTNLQAVLKEITDLLSFQFSEKGIKLLYRIDENVPQWIAGDVTRLRQILVNLISNALKFTEKGVVEVVVTAEKEKTLLIQFAVTDSGIGIPESVKSKLFQPFSQVDASTTRRFGGSGLGLVISKELCEKMGGTIRVDSVEGKGSTFTFNIQAEECQPQLRSETQNLKFVLDPEMAKKHPLRILVAEDNYTNQLVAVGLLAKLGYRADVAHNGDEVLKYLERNQYDLIFMDCHMPRMDGFEATRQIISKYGSGGRPKILALTASTTKEDLKLCFECGMDGVIGKPIVVLELIKALSECPSLKSDKKLA